MNIFKHNISKYFIFLVIFSVGLNILRVIIWEKYSFIYILWNIFLAVVPFLISLLLLSYYKKAKHNKIIFIIGSFLWLLFIPNAIYIITDFVHLGVVRGVPVLYDIVLLFTSTMVGLILGLISINHIEQIIILKFSKKTTSMFICLIIFIISFGVYLGRFLRFNSWDVFSQPVMFFQGLREIFTNITNLTEALLYTTLFFVFILIFYYLIKDIKIK